MRRFTRRLFRFGKSDGGPTAVEYAVMLALIVIIALAGIRTLGRRTNRTFRQTSRQLR